MRMVEGMSQAISCLLYTFVASREEDGGTRSVIQGLTRMFDKGAELEKIGVKNKQTYMSTIGKC